MYKSPHWGLDTFKIDRPKDLFYNLVLDNNIYRIVFIYVSYFLLNVSNAICARANYTRVNKTNVSLMDVLYCR